MTAGEDEHRSISGPLCRFRQRVRVATGSLRRPRRIIHDVCYGANALRARLKCCNGRVESDVYLAHFAQWPMDRLGFGIKSEAKRFLVHERQGELCEKEGFS